jgi:hypothetical protein
MSKTQLIRPLLKDDIGHFETYGHTVQGMVAEIDGEVVAIAGILHSYPPQAFSLLTEESDGHRKLLVQMISKFRGLLKRYPLTVYAVADEQHLNSRSVLERAGFDLIEDSLYQYKGGEA